MTTLARKLRTVDYFTLGFGTMVGVGWLVVMDDWLARGGPLGALTAAGALLGESILIPITEVGSMASAVGWLASCAAYYRIESALRERVIAAVGILVGSLLILMKFLPIVPGHFSGYEYLALALWVGLGLALKKRL